MKKSTIKSILVVTLSIFCFGMNAQNVSKIWKKASSAQTESSVKLSRTTTPQDYQLFSLNSTALKSSLAQAPARFSGNSNVVIELPTNNGEIQKFRVYEAAVMSPALQILYPNIKSYVAQGIDDRSAVARFSLSGSGLNVMISSSKYSTVYIDPLTVDQKYYMSYNISKLPADPDGFQCLVEDSENLNANQNLNLEMKNANDGLLRTFRLALACTGEYGLFHLNRRNIPTTATDEVKKATILQAMNVTMTRVNGVYERDLAVTMVIVDDNADLIYYNGATDPFTNDVSGTLINESQSVIDQTIGNNNYDIGHTFSTGGGGLASLKVPCVSGSKARGITGTNFPIGDFYDIDYVAHEMGHQFGGNHTFNGSSGSCAGGNRNNGTAFEPGSGSTIMAYAGICTPQNVQQNSDDYFHAISILEMWTNVKFGNSKCGAETATNNLPPVADAGPDYTIPASTPFILKGSATDPDSGDLLSHCWEQFNNDITTAPPTANATEGPVFRSIDPLASPNRYMPQLSTVLAGQLKNTWEVLPTVTRSMRFRYTVRDNVAGGGSSDNDNMNIDVDASAGPFRITSQDLATTWQTQTTETITWDVANTDAAPVSSPNVDIMFSEDGGLTYPISVALNVPNNGSAVVNVPNINTTTGRFMVISSNNIFYDINDGVITITGVLGTEDFSFENFTVWPNPSKGTFNLSFVPNSNDNVEVSLYDLRGRMISTTSYDDVSASGTFNKALDYNSIESGIYFLVVKNGNKVTNKKLIKN